MHELLLSASVLASRYEQILNILSGVAAMAPESIIERHLIYRPYQQPQRNMQQLGATQDIQDPSKVARLAQQSGDLYFLRLVEDWAGVDNASSSGGFVAQNGHYKAPDDIKSMTQEDDGASSLILPRGETAHTGNTTTSTTTSATESSLSKDGKTEQEQHKARWQIRFFDVPAPGKRPVTSRNVSIINIIANESNKSEEESDEEQQALAFMHGFGYKFMHQYLLFGHQFVYNNLILLLHRPLRMSDSPAAQQPRLASHARPDVSALKPLDESGGWTLEASVRISDSSNPEFITHGTNELTALRDMLRGCIDLRAVDRLALDTRVK